MGEQSESSGEANFVIEFLLKMPEIVCIKVFLFPEFPLSLGFCGEAGNEGDVAEEVILVEVEDMVVDKIEVDDDDNMNVVVEDVNMVEEVILV